MRVDTAFLKGKSRMPPSCYAPPPKAGTCICTCTCAGKAQHMTQTPAGTLYRWASTSFLSLYRQDTNFHSKTYSSSALSSLPANLPPSRMLPNMAASNR